MGCIGNPGNWGEYGKERFGLDRLEYVDTTPVFDLLAIRSKAIGFELEFTQEIPKKEAEKPENYAISLWTYRPTNHYVGPKIDEHRIEVVSATQVKEKPQLVFLELLEKGDLKEQYVYRFRLNEDLKSTEGHDLYGYEGFYTLNQPSCCGQGLCKAQAQKEKSGFPGKAKTKAQGQNQHYR